MAEGSDLRRRLGPIVTDITHYRLSGVAEGSDLRRRLGPVGVAVGVALDVPWQREAISVGDLDVSRTDWMLAGSNAWQREAISVGDLDF